VNPHLRDAFADRFAVAKITFRRPVNARLNAPFAHLVTQSGKPSVKSFGGQERIHDTDCSLFYTTIKPLDFSLSGSSALAGLLAFGYSERSA
jgi:hypothetical protein